MEERARQTIVPGACKISGHGLNRCDPRDCDSSSVIGQSGRHDPGKQPQTSFSKANQGKYLLV